MIKLSTQLRIDSNSRIPKYQQIVNSIIDDIESGNLKVGQKIPSINEVSEEYLLARDTVEKAYNYLKKQNIIVSEKGKGCYVAKALFNSKPRVLFILNKLSSYKLRIYNAFVNGMGSEAHVDLNIYHCDPQILLNILRENIGHYDYYVVMPHFKDTYQNYLNTHKEVIKVLKEIPSDKLVIMDNHLPELGDNIASIHQDFRMDIYEALQEGLPRLKKYDKLILAYPKKSLYPYPSEIVDGFRSFCVNFDFDFEILETIYPDMEIQPRDAYIIIEENDLVSLIKQIKDQKLVLGKDVGVISYNDTPLKDLLGITVISTDFKAMGATAAYMILKKKREAVVNTFHFIDRDSI
jgi:DNA-binding transcriptional regulator YhcF (GntR family)